MMGLQDILISLRSGTAGTEAGRLVVIVGVFIVLLLLTIVLVEVVRSRTPRGRVEALLDERGRTSDATRWIVRAIIVFVVLGVFWVAEVQLDNPKQCASCHSEANYPAAVAESEHKDVSCMSCHGSQGVGAPLADAATYGRWVLVYSSRKAAPDPEPGSVTSSDCLSCHGDVRTGVVERKGIRVRHSDFLEAGNDCMECHASVAHGDTVSVPKEPGMNKCLVCHDGTKAPADCDYCHVAEPETANIPLDQLPKINQLDTSNCYTCHEEKPCLRCHGVTMPHPVGWSPGEGADTNSGTHPYEGFKNRELCWRCHFAEGKPFQASDASCRCHGLLGKMHGGAAWVREHALQATGKKPGAEAECYACHTQELCVMCHPESYKDLYNPVVGWNSYERDVPYDPHYFEY